MYLSVYHPASIGTNFNRFPNKILRTILDNFNTQELISLRIVCYRWKLLIEQMCNDKKGLIIMSSRSARQVGHFCISEQFFDRTERPAIVKIVPLPPHIGDGNVILLSDEFISIVVRLFPRIGKFLFEPTLANQLCCAVNLFSLLTCWYSSLVALSLDKSFPRSLYPALCDHINRLRNLRRLDLGVQMFNDRSLLGPTFARLEHHSLVTITEKALLTALDHLRGDCLSGLFVKCHFPITLQFIRLWHRHNARLVTNLRHLRLRIDFVYVLDYICDHFVGLQILHVLENTFTSNWIPPLSRLARLREFGLVSGEIDLNSLERDSSPPLVNIRTISLIGSFVHSGAFDGPRFRRVLTAIFPNLEAFNIQLNRVRRRN